MSKETTVHEADVLVIGGGAAGCWAAIRARQNGATVIQLDKGHAGKSGCAAFAAGVLHAFNPEEDDYDEVFKLVVEDVGYIANQEQLQYHFDSAWNIVNEMADFGVEFERTPDGKLMRYPGRARVKNVMFHGPQMIEAMAKEARRRGVKQINKLMMTDLLTKDDKVVGAVGFNIVTGDWHVFKAKATVLATGSTGYKCRPPGHRNCTADGLVAAFRIGADITNSEMPMHNAFPAHLDIGPGMHMYVGTGGKFLNGKGERFMEQYAPELKERVELEYLIPCFSIEVRKGNGPIYMDMTHFTEEQVQRLTRVIPLPMLMHRRAGTCVGDRFVKQIEWMPTFPACKTGGLLTNIRYETCLPGLFAAGDATIWNGSEGGQCALIGAFTSGARAGESAAMLAKETGEVSIDTAQVKALRKKAFEPLERKDGIEPDVVCLAVQDTIAPYDVLILRKEERLKKALQTIEDIRDNLVPLLKAHDHHYLRMALEARNLATFAEIQLRSCVFRKESRGGAIREDYPYCDNTNWLKWVSVRQKDGGMEVFSQDIPVDTYPLKPPKKRELNHIWQKAKDAGKIAIKEGEVIWA